MLTLVVRLLLILAGMIGGDEGAVRRAAKQGGRPLLLLPPTPTLAPASQHESACTLYKRAESDVRRATAYSHMSSFFMLQDFSYEQL